MKKIYYLLALVVLAFTACQKQPVITPAAYTKAMTFSLATTDYALLTSSVYAYKSNAFNSVADANTYIPTVLAKRDPQLNDGSTAKISFTLQTGNYKLTDSLNVDVAYTLTPADYALVGNTFGDFSTAQVLAWLPVKYPAPVVNQLAVLTYTYFESGATPSAGVPATDAFLFVNGIWTKIYRVSNAQYASVGRGVNNWFIASDNASFLTIPNYEAQFLKNDPAVAATAKAGDIKFINYRYLTTYQKVSELYFDGTNWGLTFTLSFLRQNGSWIPDPTVYYTLVTADYTYISTTTAGSTAGRANVAQFPDFNTSAATDATYWSPTDLQNAIIAFLAHKYTAPSNGQIFNITYAVYNFGTVTSVTQTYMYNGTAFVFVK